MQVLLLNLIEESIIIMQSLFMPLYASLCLFKASLRLLESIYAVRILKGIAGI